MEARYLTDDKGNRLGILLDIKEYERLREIEDELEDIRRYNEAVAARERGEDDTVPWEEAKREVAAEREDLRSSSNGRPARR